MESVFFNRSKLLLNYTVSRSQVKFKKNLQVINSPEDYIYLIDLILNQITPTMDAESFQD
jgi:hypothetical protein